MNDTDLITFAAESILQYLYRSPRGADTIEGIHEWWIQWPVQAESILVTYAALNQLEQQGLLIRATLSKREVWRLAKNNHAPSNLDHD